TSMQTTVISSTISHEAVLPTQVLRRSAECSKRCVSMGMRLLKMPHANAPKPCGNARRAWAGRELATTSGLLRLRLREVPVPRRLEVHHVVALPAAGLLGEDTLRVEHLLEVRVLLG